MAARMTKDELREDPVLERIQGVIGFIERHGRWLLAGLVGIVVVIVAVVALQRSQARSAVEASQVLAEAQSAYLQGNYMMAESQLRTIIDEYGGTPAGPAARLYLGDALLALERPAEAIEVYERAAGKLEDRELKAAAHRGRGAALEDLKRHAEASQAYERAGELSSLHEQSDWLAAARTALDAGDAGRAEGFIERAEALVANPRTEPQLALLKAKLESAAP